MKIYGLRVDYSITAKTEPDGDFEEVGFGGTSEWDHWKDRAVDATELRSWAPWTPLDTADEWVRRIDRDKLAEMLKPYFNGGDVAYGEHVECAEAVLAALPELMGGAS